MLHNNITEGKYSVMELWPYLESLIQKHEEFKAIKASSAVDEQAFTKIIGAMEEMHRLGCVARDLSWSLSTIPEKARLARDTSNVFEQHFGPSKLPPLAGEKSHKYILDIIIPFMTFTASLSNAWWVRLACNFVSINFEEKIEEAKKLVEQNWENVREYEKNRVRARTSSVTSIGHFASETTTANSDHEQEAAHTNQLNM